MGAVYLATDRNGLLRSLDGGETWTAVDELGDTTGILGVVLDTSGSVYAASASGGLWKGTADGAWSRLGGIVDAVVQMRFDARNNVVFLLPSDNPDGGFDSSAGYLRVLDVAAGSVHAVSTPVWGSAGVRYAGFTINSANPKQILLASATMSRGSGSPRDSGAFVPREAIFQTLDGGATWSDILAAGRFDASSANAFSGLNTGRILSVAVDPRDSNHVVFGTSYGVWSTLDATSFAPAWRFADAGLEASAPSAMASSTVGDPLVAAMGEWGLFAMADPADPARVRRESDGGRCDVVSVAARAPERMIRMHADGTKGLGAWSDDAGATWHAFADAPPYGSLNCCIGTSANTNYAALSADGSTIVANMAYYGVHVSADHGGTWIESSTDPTLLVGDYQSYPVVADRVAPSLFYIYNARSGTLYRSIDRGDHWTAMDSSLVKGDRRFAVSLQVHASPRAAGDLWFTQGRRSPYAFVPGRDTVYHSRDSGRTLQVVSGLRSAIAIGFGKGLSLSLPAVYASGVDSSGALGLFRSLDDGATWKRIDDEAHSHGGATLLEGDPCIFSRIYIAGPASTGVVYGEDGVNENTCLGRVDATGSTATAPHGVERSHLVRDGTMLRGSEPIALVDLAGRVRRRGAFDGATASLDLRGLNGGVYLARCGGEVLKVILE